MNLLRDILRQRVTDLNIFQTEIATVLYEAGRVLTVHRRTHRVRNGTVAVLQRQPIQALHLHRGTYEVGVTYPYILHRGRERTLVACTFRTQTQCVVDLVSINALEEELYIYAVEISTKVDTVGQLRERVSDHFLIVLVDLTVVIEVFVFGITGMYTDLICGIGIQMRQSLCIGLVNALVLIAPERTKRHAEVSLRTVTPQR